MDRSCHSSVEDCNPVSARFRFGRRARSRCQIQATPRTPLPNVRASVAVGAAPRQDAQNDDRPAIVSGEAHTPVAYPQSPFLVRAAELDDVSNRRIADETIKRIDHAPLDGPIQPAHVAPGAIGKKPARAGAGAQPNSRRISSAGINSPRSISARASATPASSSTVTGSLSSGASARAVVRGSAR